MRLRTVGSVITTLRAARNKTARRAIDSPTAMSRWAGADSQDGRSLIAGSP